MAPVGEQLTAFVDEHRQALADCLEGLTEEEARRRLVPSGTTLLGLVALGEGSALTSSRR